TASYDTTVKIWRARPDTLVLRLTDPPPTPLELADFASDGQRMVAASADRVSLWDANGRLLASRSIAMAGFVAFDAAARRLLTGRENQAAIFSIAGGQRLMSWDHGDRATSGAFSADGEWIATGSADHLVRVWEAKSGSLVAILRGHQSAVHS